MGADGHNCGDLDMDFEEPTENDKELTAFVVDHCDRWRDYRNTNFLDSYLEYERIFRCEWAAEDKTRDSERSRIVTPATQQAVDSYLAIAPTHGEWRQGQLAGVPFPVWRDGYYRTCTSDTDEARRKAFKRARDDLMKRGDLKVDRELNRLTIPEAAALQPSMAVSGKAIAGLLNGTCGTVPGHVPDMSEGILRDGQGHLS